MKILLALDPGKTTGWSLWQYDADEPLENLSHGQIENGVEGFIKTLTDTWRINWETEIVSESFILDGRTPNPDTTPLQIEGVLMLDAAQNMTPLKFQRNNMKKHVTDDLLKQHNLYWTGQPHAVDSARHALAYVKTMPHMPSLKKYFQC